MANIYVSSVIDAPADKVWQLLRDFGGLSNWHPRIASCQIEDGDPADRVGCVRSLRLQNGDKLRERLVALSDFDTTYSYRILQSPMKIENYVATLRLTPVTDGGSCFVEWSADFDCQPQDEDALVADIGGNVFQAGFDALKRRVQR